MKKLKYVKLFESFLNEELSPELKKRTYDAMVKIAHDPNAIDSIKRRQQASNIQDSVSPAVENLRKELEDHINEVLTDAVARAEVRIVDAGLSEQGVVELVVCIGNIVLMSLIINKDKYEKGVRGSSANKLYANRAFVNTLKKLVVQIQKDEIPGEEEVPSEPESVTPEGSIDNKVSIPEESINLGHDRSAYLD